MSSVDTYQTRLTLLLDKTVLYQAAGKQRQQEEAGDWANKTFNEIEGFERKQKKILQEINGNYDHVK